MADYQEPVLLYRTPSAGSLRRAAILQVLLDAHPVPLTFKQVAERLGVNVKEVAMDMPTLVGMPCNMVARGLDAEGRLAVLSLKPRGRITAAMTRQRQAVAANVQEGGR